MTIQIVLVDDQELVRAGFRMVLDAQPDMSGVGEAGDGAAALQLLRDTPADVVVMDVRMPRLDGIEATRRICQAGDRPRVLMLTTFDLDEYAYAALKAGASGFLLKDVPPEELLFGIRAVHSGDAVVAPSTTRRSRRWTGPGRRGPELPAPARSGRRGPVAAARRRRGTAARSGRSAAGWWTGRPPRRRNGPPGCRTAVPPAARP